MLDLVIPVPDAASVAALHWLHDNGIDAGPATGTRLWGIHHLVTTTGATGPLVSVLGDGGESYRDTYLDGDWLRSKDLIPAPFRW